MQDIIYIKWLIYKYSKWVIYKSESDAWYISKQVGKQNHVLLKKTIIFFSQKKYIKNYNLYFWVISFRIIICVFIPVCYTYHVRYISYTNIENSVFEIFRNCYCNLEIYKL